MSHESDLLGAFEEHSVAGIRALVAAGASPTALINGKTPIVHLIEMYLRSPRFPACLRVLMDAGATTGNPLLDALLLDEDERLRQLLSTAPTGVDEKLHVSSAFTSCEGVTPLHICAEFNSVRCARVLLAAGANVNAVADRDVDGFGGHTPIFHAVNSIFNYCRPMLELLVEAGADLDVRLRGLLWGIGADWETLLLDVSPISYAQCGLYAQFHRQERDVYSNLSYLYEKRYGGQLPIRNVPNRYLAPNGGG
jgi:hypothetical protein